ncbi:MAG: DUF1800 domain-containing protein [Acidobacteria bacterium]|nr:DUF1800 domain-containing protein [Acidobacteriota bacterium]MBS1867467.1 DUF1800 domain-containing protein [Acidobacteriota bacterium]
MRNSTKLFAKRVAATLVAASFFCTFGIDLPSAIAATPPDKKPKQDPSLKNLPVTELSPEEAIQHALNRLAYGPRPGDVERIKQMGLAKWIDQQLNPNSIDDKAMEARLENYPTLKMSTSKLLEEYPQPKQAQKKAAKAAQAQSTEPQSRSDLAAAVVANDMRGSKGQNANVSRDVDANAAPASENNGVSMKDDPATANPVIRGNGNKLSVDPNAVPRAIADDSKRPQRVVEELAMAKVTRAIYSERQLQQVMDDFWFNHFNVYAAKGEVKWYLTSYERDVIQPHTLGKFKDLIEATAKSPAMLFYLDNFLSVDPRAQQRLAAQRAARQANRRGFGWPPLPRPQQQQKKQDRGLNENYGRELMELHTLGVDGGYTQKDVTEVARCFTGWTIEKPRQNPEFKFDDRMHDPDTKVVLGKKIHAGGMNDGKEVIELLAKNPNTAKFISTKLARRFVSDNPPPALIAKMSQTFQSSDGDIRAVMRAMIYSPEFWSREAFRAKIKTPYELVISAARALGTDVDTPMPLVQWTSRIGEPLYQCQPPTGYSDKADAWVNTGALLNRLNYSLALASNKVRGSHSDAATLLGLDLSADPKAALNRAVELFLGGEAARGTVETLEKQVEDPQILQARLDDPVKRVDMGIVTGLVLGAPEFQRR